MGIDICISYPITMSMTKTTGHTKKQCQNATIPASKGCPNIEIDFQKGKEAKQDTGGTLAKKMIRTVRLPRNEEKDMDLIWSFSPPCKELTILDWRISMKQKSAQNSPNSIQSIAEKHLRGERVQRIPILIDLVFFIPPNDGRSRKS
jgi:hypothetical protein